jgi:hypothetical protein
VVDTSSEAVEVNVGKSVLDEDRCEVSLCVGEPIVRDDEMSKDNSAVYVEVADRVGDGVHFVMDSAIE